MKKGHRTVFQNAWSQKKTNTLIEKTILLPKKLTNSYEKRHRSVFQNAWSQKNKHFHWKTILFQKSLQIHMKKGHRTAFQNAWSQKDQHSHWKNNVVSKKLVNSKNATGPFSKMPESQKTNTLIEKTILLQKSL